MKKIDIEISNMLRIESAKLTLQPGKITTVSGPNEAGKTSIATLVGAILSRSDNPLGYGRATGKIYLRDDSDAGHASVTLDGEPIARWDAVSGDVQNFDVDNTIKSTPGALGLVKFTHHMTPAQKTALWEGYFLPPAKTIRDQVHKQLSSVIDNETLVDQICELVSDGDMSTALKVYEGRRRDAKTAWKRITGEDYGAAKAPDWIPEGWSASMDGRTVEDLTEELQVEQDSLRNMQIGEAVSAQQIAEGMKAKEQIKEIVGKIVEHQKKMSGFIKQLDEHAKPMADIKQKAHDKVCQLNAHLLDRPEKTDYKICGACGAHLLQTHEATMPVHDEVAFLEQVRKWEDRRDELEQEYEPIEAERKALKEKIEPITHDQAKLQAEIQDLKGRMRILEKVAMHADKEESEVDHDAVGKIEENIQTIRDRIAMIKRREEAFKHHRDVMAYDEVVKILGPKGVRALAVSQNMGKFRKVLANVHKVTDWAEVEMDDSYNLSIGGRKFMEVCGETPRLRAQYAVQIAIAVGKGEPVVILDMVDHLQQVHQKTLNELLTRICKLETAPAFLICGTTGHFNPDLFPDATHHAVEAGVLQ